MVGSVKCNCSFASYQGLMSHCRKCHAVRTLEGLAIVSNQCPICGSVFRSRVVALHHFTVALKSGKCRVQATRASYPIKLPRCLTCPICIAHNHEQVPHEFAEFFLFQRHILDQHLPPLERHILTSSYLLGNAGVLTGGTASRATSAAKSTS